MRTTTRTTKLGLSIGLALGIAGCNRPAGQSDAAATAPSAPPLSASDQPLGPGDYVPQSNSTATPVSYDATSEAAADYFYDQLTPYGQWVVLPDYGPAWQPANMPVGWRPYSLGYWTYTDDYGWYWVSEERFGWVTYHYGRWAMVPGGGWYWVPGRKWGPAWVTWRHGGGYTGWAALPPAQRGHAADLAVNVDPFAYTFVADKYLADPHARDHFQPLTRNVSFLQDTQDVTRFAQTNGRVIDRGVDVNEVQKAAGHPIEHLKVTDAADPSSAGVGKGQVAIFHPEPPAPAAVEPAAPQTGGAQLAGDHSGDRGTTSRFATAPHSALPMDDSAAARRQRSAYYQQMGTDMQQRHAQELQGVADGPARRQIVQRQQLEQRTFQEHYTENRALPSEDIRKP